MTGYAAENAASGKRLAALVASLSADDLARSMPNGWTVAQTLVHIAFWDRVQRSNLERWMREETAVSAGGNPTAVNDGVVMLAGSIDGWEAARLVVASAAEVDRAVEEVPEAVAGAIFAGGQERLLRRSLHRLHHVSALERVLGRKAEDVA